MKTFQEDELLEFSRIINPGVADVDLPDLMAVGLFGDESESHDPHVFTLAGFITSPTGWQHFVPHWREMLCKVGPYPVDAFHSNPIEKAKPPFDGWTIEQRDSLVTRAVDILADPVNACSNLYAIGCTLVVDDLKAAVPSLLGRARTQDLYVQCYLVLFHNILKFSPFKGIDFIFDRKAKAEGRVKAHFDAAKEILDKDPETAGRLNECIFRDDRKFMPLQAADLLAYELRRRTWDRVKDHAIPIRPTYQKLKDVFEKTATDSKPPYRQRIFRCYDRRFIEGLSTTFKEPEYQPITSEDASYLWFHMDIAED